MIEKSRGIILNSIKYGDSSKIVTVFTREFGKLAFIAKGARTAKSKFGASLELLTISEFTFYNKINSDLLILSNSDIIKSSAKISKDSNQLLIGLMIAEVINNSQEKRNINSDLYDFAQQIILELYNMNESPFHLFNKFMYGLSTLMGFALYLDNFGEHSGEIAINLENGNLISENTLGKNNFKFRNEEISYFYSLVKDENYTDFILDKKSINHFYDFWVQYFSFHLERKFVLKSAVFL